MAGTKVSVGTTVSLEEKAQLEAEAREEGITLSALIYRRAMNKPDAERRPGRPPKHPRNQPEGLFQMTG